VWKIPENQLSLTNNQVHIWRAKLDLSANEIVRLETLLSEDEKLRANRFRFPQHRRRFIAARAILREILANYLQINSYALRFEYSDRGKPKLAKSMEASSWQFNVSHSQELALYGFTCHKRIGVDVEYLRPMDDAAKIAERFFSAQESQLIANLTGEQQKQVFFQLWTAKEAYLKAIGVGLVGSLAGVNIDLDLDIDLDQAKSLALLSIEEDVQAAASWLMYPCVPETNYIATVAIESKTEKQQIDFWNWN
jgi:4'-phosphopantetheinyl transferase